MTKRAWRDVERSAEKAWFAVMGGIFTGQITSDLCPSCSNAELRYFYLRSHESTTHRGGFWIWCPACRRFMHTSGSVPRWWRDVPGVTGKLLEPQPEWLEAHWDEIAAHRGDAHGPETA